MVNIFCCDLDPKRAASMLSYTGHTHKMLLESLQIMAAVAERYNFQRPITKSGAPYRINHRNHPAVHWAAADRRNFLWLLNHAHGLRDVVLMVSQKPTATTTTLQKYHNHALKLSELLPRNDCFILYNQDKTSKGELVTSLKWKNLQIIKSTLQILCKKYRTWQCRMDKRKIKPTWPHFDHLLPAPYKRSKHSK